jgi:hypothetical protein
MADVELNEKTVKSLPKPEAGNRIHFFAGATLQGIKAPAASVSASPRTAPKPSS